MPADLPTPDPLALAAQAREMLEGVTPGPWEIGEDQSDPYTYLYSLHIYATGGDEDDDPMEIAWANCSQDPSQDRDGPRLKAARPNARFIAWCREAVPTLATCLEQMAAEMDRLRSSAEKTALNLLGVVDGSDEALTAMTARAEKAEHMAIAERATWTNALTASEAKRKSAEKQLAAMREALACAIRHCGLSESAAASIWPHVRDDYRQQLRERADAMAQLFGGNDAG